jgi:hypothetical protein
MVALTRTFLSDIMTNAWSLLYDELKMSETFETKELPYPLNNFATEPIQYTISTNFKDTISLTNNSPAIPWKYNEEKIVKELLEYVRGTYNQHYSAGDDKIQTLDLIEACGDGEAFCRSNILKYASRYDKKGTARRDIMKILHYAVLLMNFNDKNAKREVYSQ